MVGEVRQFLNLAGARRRRWEETKVSLSPEFNTPQTIPPQLSAVKLVERRNGSFRCWLPNCLSAFVECEWGNKKVLCVCLRDAAALISRHAQFVTFACEGHCSLGPALPLGRRVTCLRRLDWGVTKRQEIARSLGDFYGDFRLLRTLPLGWVGGQRGAFAVPPQAANYFGLVFSNPWGE